MGGFECHVTYQFRYLIFQYNKDPLWYSLHFSSLYIYIYIFELLLFLYTPVAYLREFNYFQCIRTVSMPRRRVPLWREIFIPMVLCAL